MQGRCSEREGRHHRRPFGCHSQGRGRAEAQQFPAAIRRGEHLQPHRPCPLPRPRDCFIVTYSRKTEDNRPPPIPYG